MLPVRPSGDKSGNWFDSGGNGENLAFSAESFALESAANSQGGVFRGMIVAGFVFPGDVPDGNGVRPNGDRSVRDCLFWRVSWESFKPVVPDWLVGIVAVVTAHCRTFETGGAGESAGLQETVGKETVPNTDPMQAWRESWVFLCP